LLTCLIFCTELIVAVNSKLKSAFSHGEQKKRAGVALAFDLIVSPCRT